MTGTTESNTIYGYAYNTVEFASYTSYTYLPDNGYILSNCSLLPTTSWGHPAGLTVRSTCGPGRSKLVRTVIMDVSILISIRHHVQILTLCHTKLVVKMHSAKQNFQPCTERKMVIIILINRYKRSRGTKGGAGPARDRRPGARAAAGRPGRRGPAGWLCIPKVPSYASWMPVLGYFYFRIQQFSIVLAAARLTTKN